MAEILSCIPLKSGRNNQVFRLDLSPLSPNWETFCHSAHSFHLALSPPNTPFPHSHHSLILKRYFQHPEDMRPRLHAEFSFLSFAADHDIPALPKPLAYHPEENWGLYTFLPGNPIAPHELTYDAIQQALRLFLTLNQHKTHATHLPIASEACLHSQDFYKSVEKRLLKLRSSNDPELLELLNRHLLPLWNQLKDHPYPHQSLSSSDLCITPSDFGFHNALSHNGIFSFIDFEYAGWDDPAKTICDFFCQPKVPVPLDYFEEIASAMAQTVAQPHLCLERARHMLPLCQLKWVCIMLGGLLGVGKERRAFAGDDTREQLKKTREYLCRIKTSSLPFIKKQSAII